MSEEKPKRKYEWKKMAPGIEVTHPHPEVTVVMLRHPPFSDVKAIQEWATSVLMQMLAKKDAT